MIHNITYFFNLPLQNNEITKFNVQTSVCETQIQPCTPGGDNVKLWRNIQALHFNLYPTPGACDVIGMNNP